MASPFQRYQGGIEASTGNLVQASGQMAAMTANTIAGFGQNLAQGLQQYNENSAKNDILTSEAEALGQQIQQFAAQFGDSPEHKPFADSLQPYIQQLAKVPSQSLTQKMGTVTGVKAAFANVGQQLQAFELMRGERLKRDYWAARNQTPTTNVVTDPVAIAKGEVPWDDTKTYDQNIAGFRAVAQKAIDNGVAIDIEKASGLYVANIKQALKTGRDKSGKPIAPETLSALQDQIAKGESFEQDLLNTYLSEDQDVAFGSMMNLGDTLKSARDKVNEQKVAKAKAEGKPIPVDDEKELIQKRTSIETAIDALSKRIYKNKNVTKADLDKFNNDKVAYESEKKSIEAKIAALKETPEKTKTISDEEYKQILEKQYGGGAGANTRAQLDGWSSDRVHGGSKNRKWFKTAVDSNVSRTLEYWSGKLTELESKKPTAPDQQMDILTDNEFNDKVEELNKQGSSRYTAVTELERQGWERSKDAKGNQIWVNRNPIDKSVVSALETYRNELNKLPVPKGSAQKPVDARTAEADSVKRKAKDELSKIDALIKQADKAVEEERDIPMGWMDKAAFAMESGFVDSINQKGLHEMAQMYISQGRFKEITPDNARMLLDEVNKDSMGSMAILGNLVTPNFTRELSRAEERALEGAFTEWRSQDRIRRIEKSGDSKFLKEELLKRKELLQGQLSTGRSAPKPADLAKVQQAQAKKAEVEKPTLIGTANNLVIGTKKREVRASVEQQETEMANFFQKKYGYVPAGFSDMYRTNTPEANFKTMETPYGAFMWDGKGWSQIKAGTPMSAKEIGENAAYQFSNPDGSPREFANSGVYLSGTFQGTTTELAKFRTEYRSLAHAEKSIARLIEINEMTGESLSPTLKGEAKALLPAIKAALRTEIIGVGTVSNYEQELINDVVAGAADFWSLESSDRAKLLVIMDRVRNSINDVPVIYGLSVQRKGDSANVEKTLRQSLLNSGNMSSREAKWRAANPDKQ